MPSLRNFTVQKIFRVPQAATLRRTPPLIVSITNTSLKEFIRRGERERERDQGLRPGQYHHHDAIAIYRNCAVDDARPTARLFSQTRLRKCSVTRAASAACVPAWLALRIPQPQLQRCGTVQDSLLIVIVPQPQSASRALSSSSLVISIRHQLFKTRI
jgi:hypothetical protein